MRKILILLLILVILLANHVYSEESTCQYKINQTYEKDVNVFYKDGTELDFPLFEAKDFSKGYNEGTNFNVYNQHIEPITVIIWWVHGSETLESEQYTIPVDGIQPIQTAAKDVQPDQIKYKILTPGLESRREKRTILNETCKKCDGIICQNDGSSCLKSSVCGGTFCIRGCCSNSEVCCNNDCKCVDVEVQCDDNKRCVKKGVVAIDVKPKCDKTEECVTGYIDSVTGLCGKSPTQKIVELEKRLDKVHQQRTLLMVLLIILAVIIIYGYLIIIKRRKEAEEEKRKRIESEIKRFETETKRIEAEKALISKSVTINIKEISEIEFEINEIKKKKNIRREEMIKLNRLEEELKTRKEKLDEEKKGILSSELELKTFKKRLAKERSTPYQNRQGYMVTRNEYNYEMYKNRFFHIWWFEKNSKNPEDKHVDTNKYNVHHIDGDRTNNEFWNLIKLDKDIHSKIHRNEKPWRDHKEGLRILKKYMLHIPKRIEEQRKQTKLSST